MTKSVLSNSTKSKAPRRQNSNFNKDLVRLLGEPALLNDDNQTAYVALERNLINAVKPRDAIEQIFVRDVADLTWEIQRLKLARSHLIDQNLHEGLTSFLSEHLKGEVPAYLASLKWKHGDPVVSREIKRFLKVAGVNRDMIISETIRRLMDEYETFHSATSRLEARRRAILYEIDQHRHMLAYLLKEELKKMDTDFEIKQLPSHGVAVST